MHLSKKPRKSKNYRILANKSSYSLLSEKSELPYLNSVVLNTGGPIAGSRDTAPSSLKSNGI